MTYAVRVEKELEVEESPNFAVSWIKGCLSIVYQFLVLRTIAALNVRTMGVLLFFLRGSIL